LTTLLHEVAHAATWERHRGGFLRRRRLRPHGAEWKREFSAVLAPVVEAGVFPDDVATAVARSLQNPAAATCSSSKEHGFGSMGGMHSAPGGSCGRGGSASRRAAAASIECTGYCSWSRWPRSRRDGALGRSR
jgi:hypothetical protein